MSYPLINGVGSNQPTGRHGQVSCLENMRHLTLAHRRDSYPPYKCAYHLTHEYESSRSRISKN